MTGSGAECPFCEDRPADRMDHIVRCHRDRLRATMLYQRVLAAGGTTAEAQTAYNESLLPHRPGVYDRASLRRAS